MSHLVKPSDKFNASKNKELNHTILKPPTSELENCDINNKYTKQTCTDVKEEKCTTTYCNLYVNNQIKKYEQCSNDKTFFSIESALEYVKKTGICNQTIIHISQGYYGEDIVVQDLCTCEDTQLTLLGDERDIVAVNFTQETSWNPLNSNVFGLGGGSGSISLFFVETNTYTGTSTISVNVNDGYEVPNFNALGIICGDILVYRDTSNSNNITYNSYRVISTMNNTITIQGIINRLVGQGTSFYIRPNVSIKSAIIFNSLTMRGINFCPHSENVGIYVYGNILFNVHNISVYGGMIGVHLDNESYIPYHEDEIYTATLTLYQFSETGLLVDNFSGMATGIISILSDIPNSIGFYSERTKSFLINNLLISSYTNHMNIGSFVNLEITDTLTMISLHKTNALSLDNSNSSNLYIDKLTILGDSNKGILMNGHNNTVNIATVFTYIATTNNTLNVAEVGNNSVLIINGIINISLDVIGTINVFSLYKGSKLYVQSSNVNSSENSIIIGRQSTLFSIESGSSGYVSPYSTILDSGINSRVFAQVSESSQIVVSDIVEGSSSISTVTGWSFFIRLNLQSTGTITTNIVNSKYNPITLSNIPTFFVIDGNSNMYVDSVTFVGSLTASVSRSSKLIFNNISYTVPPSISQSLNGVYFIY